MVGYDPLPEDLVQVRGLVPQPEVRQALRVGELRDPLPRAFWVPAAEVVADAAGLAARAADSAFDPRQVVLLGAPPPAGRSGAPVPGEARVSYERVDAHTVRISGTTPPGFIVVLDGYDAAWRLHDEGGQVPLLRAYGRYWAVPTGGGTRAIV